MASFIPGFAFIVCSDNDVMRQRPFIIDGHRILATRADISNLPYQMYNSWRYLQHHETSDGVNQLLLQPESEETSPKNLLNALNEDCVCTILMRLTLVDLCSIAKTCRRLNKIARAVFERKYKNKTISLGELVQNGGTMTTIRYFLNNFGSSIESISLLTNIEDVVYNDVVGLVAKECKDMTALVLNGKFMENFVIANHVDMFGRLKEFHFILGFVPLNQLLAVCPQLELLDVATDEDLDLDLKNVSLPNLIELNLYLRNCSGIEAFLRHHPCIEGFALKSPADSDRQHFESNELICKFLPNIRKIELYRNELLPIIEMKNLKSVELTFIDYWSDLVAPSVNQFLVQNAAIEELIVYGGTIDDSAIECICKIQTIKELQLNECDDFDIKKFIRLVGALPNLKKIICSMMEPGEFLDKILPILQNKGIEWSDDYSESGYVSKVYF